MRPARRDTKDGTGEALEMHFLAREWRTRKQEVFAGQGDRLAEGLYGASSVYQILECFTGFGTRGDVEVNGVVGDAEGRWPGKDSGHAAEDEAVRAGVIGDEKREVVFILQREVGRDTGERFISEVGEKVSEGNEATCL